MNWFAKSYWDSGLKKIVVVSSHLKKIYRLTSMQLTFWFALCMTLSMLMVFALTYGLLLQYSAEDNDNLAHHELLEMRSAYHTGGEKGLKRAVEIEVSGEMAGIYVRLESTDRNILFSNQSKWDDQFNFSQKHFVKKIGNLEFDQIPLKNGDDDKLNIASTTLSDGHRLEVGVSTKQQNELLEHFEKLFFLSAIPLLLIAILTGAWLAYKAFAPVRTLSATIEQAIVTGNISARVPIKESTDDLARLGKGFNQLLSRIQHLISTMNDSLDHLSHDLRTPMTRLRAFAERALESRATREDLQEAALSTIEESDKILSLLSCLMDLTVAEAGALRLQKEQVPVSEFISRAVELYEYPAEAKGISILSEVAKDLSVFVDRNRVVQVFANLLDNAVKYSDVGGDISINAQILADEILISVSDQGRGIAAEAQTTIWNRLQRGGNILPDEPGSGLGLSLVKSIVVAHGGRVEVRTELNKGSTFFVYFPIISQGPLLIVSKKF